MSIEPACNTGAASTQPYPNHPHRLSAASRLLNGYTKLGQDKTQYPPTPDSRAHNQEWPPRAGSEWMSNPPPNSVIEAFNITADLEPLAGGEGYCWRAGELILKPDESPVVWRWFADHLSTVKTEGFRLPLPVCACDGRWVVDGWSVQEAVEGEHPEQERWGDVILTGDRFHKAIENLPRPPFLDNRSDDPWSLGDFVAWEEIEPPFANKRLTELLRMRSPIVTTSQLIHGDLTENILFAEGLSPAVIDFSPYWRPVGFASAIVVADAVCWRDADPSGLFKHVSHVEHFPQLLIRALVYRMVTTIAFSRGEPALEGYDPGIDLAKQLAS